MIRCRRADRNRRRLRPRKPATFRPRLPTPPNARGRATRRERAMPAGRMSASRGTARGLVCWGFAEDSFRLARYPAEFEPFPDAHRHFFPDADNFDARSVAGAGRGASPVTPCYHLTPELLHHSGGKTAPIAKPLAKAEGCNKSDRDHQRMSVAAAASPRCDKGVPRSRSPCTGDSGA